MPVRVKICGLTDPAQARSAIALGAEAVGVVFAGTKRRLDADQAARVVAAVPPGRSVAVFVDASAEQINALAETVRFSAVQLHGDEPPELVARLTRPAIKAFRVNGPGWLEPVAEWVARARACLDGGEPRSGLAGILLDTFDPDEPGGTGESFNWQWIADARRDGAMDSLPPILLAGGLTAANVAQAVRVARPWGVDVSTGVETSPGQKDLAAVEAFITAAVSAG